MGTVPSTLGKVAFEAAEKGLQTVSDKYAGERAGALAESTKTLMSKTFGLESTLTGKSGAFAQEHLRMFESAFDKQLSVNLEKLRAGKLPVDLGDPSKGFHDPVNTPRHIVETRSRTAARNQVFGNSDEILSAITHATKLEHGELKAKNLVDNLGVYFHEQVKQGDSGQFGARLTSNLHKNPLTKELPTNPSPYNKREFFNDHPGLESTAHTVGSMAFAYKAGLVHLSTMLNGLIGNSLSSFAKASLQAFGPGYESARAMLQTYNALGTTGLEELDQMYKFRNGIISKYAPGSIGEFIHKNYAIPGFTAVKQRTATMFSLQGHYSALEYAHDLIEHQPNVTNTYSGRMLTSIDPDKFKRAYNNLTWLGINPKDVIANGGQLTKEQIRQAMFENTNQKLFTQSSARNRSQWATASPLGRVTSMYHGFAAAQGNFIQRELHKNYINKDVMGMIKTISILGTVYPEVGIAIGGLSAVWMHPTKAAQTLSDTKDKMEHMMTDPAIMERIEGISHTAGFGLLTSFSRAIGRKKAADYMIGPLLNAGKELAQDGLAISPSKDAQKGDDKVKSWEPFARDVLHDIPSLGLGNYISDTLLPNQQELGAKKPMTRRRVAARRSAQKHKLKNAPQEESN